MLQHLIVTLHSIKWPKPTVERWKNGVSHKKREWIAFCVHIQTHIFLSVAIKLANLNVIFVFQNSFVCILKYKYELLLWLLLWYSTFNVQLDYLLFQNPAGIHLTETKRQRDIERNRKTDKTDRQNMKVKTAVMNYKWKVTECFIAILIWSKSINDFILWRKCFMFY